MSNPQTMLAFLAPLGWVAATGKPYISFLKRRYMGQYIREDGPQSHQSKAGTPTAGGVLILTALLVGLLALTLWLGPDFWTPGVWVVAVTTVVFAVLGFVDDYLKIAKKHNKGVSGYTKLAVQVLIGLWAGWMMMRQPGGGVIHFFHWGAWEAGWLYPLFTAFVMTGASNAVNLTDGLDGLAASTAVMTFLALALMLARVAPELALVAHILTGACVGFLIFNRYPAQVFMGDTGSLALGGAMGALAVAAGIEFWLALLAGVYIVETLSVILQVIAFKTTGKRIFRMSPLHHHFELGGWSEPRVVFSFVTFQMLCCVAALFLYNGG